MIVNRIAYLLIASALALSVSSSALAAVKSDACEGFLTVKDETGAVKLAARLRDIGFHFLGTRSLLKGLSSSAKEPSTSGDERAEKSIREYLSIGRRFSKFIAYWPKISASIALGAIALNTPSAIGMNTPRDVDKLNPNEFEIVIGSPAIHEDLRIGDTVYTYGSGIIYKKTYTEYQKAVSGTAYENSIRIRIVVSVGEVRQLETAMNKELGKNYVYGPPLFTCVSATNLAIERSTSIYIPAGVNRSPALTQAWLKARQLLGDSRIENVYFTGTKPIDAIMQMAVASVDSGVASFGLLSSVLVAPIDYFPNTYGGSTELSEVSTPD